MASIRDDILASELFGVKDADPSYVLGGMLHLLEWLAAGLAERHAGLIYLLPLCHDSPVLD